ncbi:hypothetical protein FRB93_004968 [Tulasnella sp. JGI-2019a]|nr:hypothetical protein FRB93_004968 [Tulasnella sp. JGI-2019a]
MKEWNPKLTGLSRIETKVAYDKWMKRNKAIIDSMVLHALLRPKEKLDMVDTHGMLLVLVHNLEATTPENFFFCVTEIDVLPLPSLSRILGPATEGQGSMMDTVLAAFRRDPNIITPVAVCIESGTASILAQPGVRAKALGSF